MGLVYFLTTIAALLVPVVLGFGENAALAMFFIVLVAGAAMSGSVGGVFALLIIGAIASTGALN